MDYTHVSSSKSIGAGSSSRSVSITLPVPFAQQSEVSFEGPETFRVTLTSATNGASISGSNTATATVIDNDNAPYFIVNDARVNENAGTATVYVQCMGETSIPQTVDFSTSADTATAGADFTNQSGTLSYAGGVNLQSFTVPITDDGIYEGDEDFIVTLSNPQGGTTIQDGTGSVTINDDDSAPEFSLAANQSEEEGNTLTFRINKTGSTAQAHSISYDQHIPLQTTMILRRYPARSILRRQIPLWISRLQRTKTQILNQMKPS